MDNYDSIFFEQLVPLLYFQTQDSNHVSAELLKYLDQYNVKNTVWDNSIIKNRLSNRKYRIKAIESEYHLPEDLQKNYKDGEHSILSPFNAGSDLFPNGIISEKWFKKYIEDVPFAIISTFKLSDDPQDDKKLAEQITLMKKSYSEVRINLVAIIISDSQDADENDRISQLRQSTGLARITGLLYLNSSPSTINRDSEILVTSLLSNLKNSAIDFYLNIEHKIKQRHKKYYSCSSASDIDTSIELTPIFLETRNLIKQGIINQLVHPHNLESSLKHLEIAYQNLIEISKDKFAGLLVRSPSAHDLNLYNQFRNLIDVIAFHIVRGYFSLEEPITALKKHKAHIVNVLDVFSLKKGDNNNWVSIQYQWLGELMSIIPKSILSGINIKTYKKKSKNTKIVEFFGGLQFHENYNYDLITHPGFVFLKSAEYLTTFCVLNDNFKYLNDKGEQDSISKQRIALYKLAKDNLLAQDNFSKSSSDIEDKLGSFNQYISWLIANEYSKLPNDDSSSKIIEFYELCLSESQFRNTRISQLVLDELLKCYLTANDFNKLLFTILRASSFSNSVTPLQINSLKAIVSNSDTIDLNSLGSASIDIFQMDVLLFNDKFNTMKAKETVLYDSCVCQLVLEPTLNLNTLKKIFSNLGDDVSVELSIKKAEIKFSGVGNKRNTKAFKNVHLEEGSNVSQNLDLQRIELEDKDNTLRGKFNVKISNNDARAEPKVIQFLQPAQKAGTDMIESITLDSEITIISKDHKLVLAKKEVRSFGDIDSGSICLHKWVYSTEGGMLNKKAIRLPNQAPHAIKILPLKPDVIVTMATSNMSSIIIGEKFSIPFEIEFKNPKNQKVNYKKILLSPNVKIIADEYENGSSSLLTTQVNWDSLKDDEPLSLQSLVSNDQESKVHKLNICILNPSLNVANEGKSINKSLRLSIDLKTLVSEDTGENIEGGDEDEELTIYDTADYTLSVVNAPFECKFTISPRYRNDDAIDMPCPFVISESKEGALNSEKVNNYSMPISTRLWLGKLSLVDNLMQSEKQNELQIMETDVSLKSKNSELFVETVDTPTDRSSDNITQLFTTKSKNGFSHRNVSISAAVNIKWKRKENTTINEFKSDEWEIVLPLSDPRVLFDLVFESQNRAKFKYIIENPTPRLFMFATQLSTEEIDDRLKWQFDDDRNIVPLKQATFPVLPFNRNVIEFYAKLTNNSDEKLVALPQFKVFDVHYKVTLPTLAVCENVVVKSNNTLYWQAND